MQKIRLRSSRSCRARDAGRRSRRSSRSELFPVAAAERSRNPLRVSDALDQHVDAVAAPEQFAIEHHGGYAEHAERLGFVDDAVVFRACGTTDIGFELPRRSAERGNHRGYLRQVVDVEIVAPEPPEYRLMIRPEEAVLFRKQHAGAGTLSGRVPAHW